VGPCGKSVQNELLHEEEPRADLVGVQPHPGMARLSQPSTLHGTVQQVTVSTWVPVESQYRMNSYTRPASPRDGQAESAFYPPWDSTTTNGIAVVRQYRMNPYTKKNRVRTWSASDLTQGWPG